MVRDGRYDKANRAGLNLKHFQDSLNMKILIFISLDQVIQVKMVLKFQ